jgi:hypothetical protein
MMSGTRTRSILSYILGLLLLASVVGITAGCIVRTEPRRGYHRESRHHGAHRHCHTANGPRHKRVCHRHPHNARHH